MPLLESTDNNAMSSPAPTSTARRSGRVVKAPARLTPDAPAAGKRKRDTALDDDDDEENNPPDLEEDESDAEADDDDDEDVIEEAPKRKRPSQAAKGKRPAAKRPKTNGTAPSGSRHAAMPSRPKKAVRIEIERREGDDLFGELVPVPHH
jgi:cohesin complex subunit SA-1/2